MKVLVLVARGLQASLVGCYGNHWVTTPALDRLAARGVVFDACYADAAGPDGTRRSWRTGRMHLPVPGVTTEPPAPADLLAQLRAADVPTMLIHDVSRPLPEAFLDGWSATVEVAPEGDEAPLELALEGAAEVLDALRDEAAALVWLDLAVVLPPWDVPADFVAALFEEEEVEETEDDEDEEEAEEEEAVEFYDDEDEAPPEFVAAPALGPIDAADDHLAASLRTSCGVAVNYLDAALEQLFELLDGIDPKREMAVVFTSDHGLPLGEHGVIGVAGALPHEELLHVPLIVRLPGEAQAGRRVPALCQPIDLAATLLDLFGLGLPEAHGRSLLPLARGEAAMTRPYLLSGVRTDGGVVWALRTPTWSFVLGETGRLFLQPEDAWEANDVRQHHLDLAERIERTLREAVTASRQPGPLVLPELPEDEPASQDEESEQTGNRNAQDGDCDKD